MTSEPEFRPHPVEWTPVKVERFWDYVATHQPAEFFSEKHARDIADRLVKASRPRSVVDVGCGTGPLVAEFTRRGIAATGIKHSANALEAAQRRSPRATFHLGSIVAIPMADRSMDAATLIETVEHLDDDILHAALAEARRVLRSGGTLLITTPNDERLADSSRPAPTAAQNSTLTSTSDHGRRSRWQMRCDGNFQPVSVAATRLVEDCGRIERIPRKSYYRIRRQASRGWWRFRVGPRRDVFPDEWCAPSGGDRGRRVHWINAR